MQRPATPLLCRTWWASRPAALPLAMLHLVSLPLWACRRHAPPPPPAAPVQVATVPAREVAQSSEYVATLVSRQQVAIFPEVVGRVVNIAVRSGMEVGAGQLLMEVDPRIQRATVRSARATEAAQRAQLIYARRQYERMERLFQRGLVARADLDQARQSFDAAAAQTHSFAHQARAQAVELGYYQVRAPVAGIVGDIPAHRGDYVTQQTQLTTLNVNRALEAYIDVPVERAPELRIGLTTQILVGALSEREVAAGLAQGLPAATLGEQGQVAATAELDFVAPQVDPTTQTLLAKCTLANADGRLRAGQFVRARVVWSRKRMPVVPVLSVLRQGSQAFVFLAEEQRGRLVARQRPITLGPLVGQVYVVEQGVKAGERVVVSGIQRLADGMPIARQSRAAEAPPMDGGAPPRDQGTPTGADASPG